MRAICSLRTRLLALTVALATAGTSQPPTFKADVKLVTLTATVRDKDGRYVNDLTKSDFVLEEDGRVQSIRYLSPHSDAPLSVGLVVDTSRSQRGVLQRSKQATYTFLDQALRDERDEAFVLRFDLRVGLLQAFTNSRPKLKSALERLTVPFYAGSRLFDAIKHASDECMRPRTGRKALIVISDGEDDCGHTSISSAIEHAQRANTIILSVVNSDTASGADAAKKGSAHTDREQIMHRLADETGGRTFDLSSETSIDAVYTQIASDLQQQYSIAYVSDRASEGDTKYRTIRLRVKDRTYSVRTRDGYFPN